MRGKKEGVEANDGRHGNHGTQKNRTNTIVEASKDEWKRREIQ